ncbi:PEP-CTERM sorting domain-containing protein [Crateriforma spongiae]|uniref:PEP-CTERM sorting domain-containing protein n=1 Tax=Crateriforma spongiae TaxID=2724528 RepID=UPI0039AF91E3
MICFHKTAASLVAVLLVAGVARQSCAEVSISVALTRTDGLGVGDAFDPNSTIFADFSMELLASDSVGSFQTSIVYDATELRLVNAEQVAVTGLPIELAPGVDDSVPGEIRGFDAATFVGGVQGPTSFVFGRAEFVTLEQPIGTVDDGLADITPFFTGFDGVNAVGGAAIDPVGIIFNPASVSITAVPEPTSLAALGLISSGVAYRMRRRRKMAAKK